MVGNSLAGNLKRIKEQIAQSCQRSGRSQDDVRCLAVSKGQTIAAIKAAQALGLRSFGENYVQEWQKKSAELSDLDLNWHFIGHLQSNKAKAVVGRVDLIHSVDRTALAEEIGRRAQGLGRTQKILVEVNFASEASKSGAVENDVPDLLRNWSGIPGLSLCGIMVMPPMSERAEASRPYFAKARQRLEEWRPLAAGHPFRELSMGTSQDYAVAIEEGATIVRLGTVLFGPRS